MAGTEVKNTAQQNAPQEDTRFYALVFGPRRGQTSSDRGNQIDTSKQIAKLAALEAGLHAPGIKGDAGRRFIADQLDKTARELGTSVSRASSDAARAIGRSMWEQASKDASAIVGSFTGWFRGNDSERIVSTLRGKSPEEIELIKAAYGAITGRSLRSDVSENFGTLSSIFHGNRKAQMLAMLDSDGSASARQKVIALQLKHAVGLTGLFADDATIRRIYRENAPSDVAAVRVNVDRYVSAETKKALDHYRNGEKDKGDAAWIEKSLNQKRFFFFNAPNRDEVYSTLETTLAEGSSLGKASDRMEALQTAYKGQTGKDLRESLYQKLDGSKNPPNAPGVVKRTPEMTDADYIAAENASYKQESQCDPLYIRAAALLDGNKDRADAARLIEATDGGSWLFGWKPNFDGDRSSFANRAARSVLGLGTDEAAVKEILLDKSEFQINELARQLAILRAQANGTEEKMISHNQTIEQHLSLSPEEQRKNAKVAQDAYDALKSEYLVKLIDDEFGLVVFDKELLGGGAEKNLLMLSAKHGTGGDIRKKIEYIEARNAVSNDGLLGGSLGSMFINEDLIRYKDAVAADFLKKSSPFREAINAFEAENKRVAMFDDLTEDQLRTYHDLQHRGALASNALAAHIDERDRAAADIANTVGIGVGIATAAMTAGASLGITATTAGAVTAGVRTAVRLSLTGLEQHGWDHALDIGQELAQDITAARFSKYFGGLSKYGPQGMAELPHPQRFTGTLTNLLHDTSRSVGYTAPLALTSTFMNDNVMRGSFDKAADQFTHTLGTGVLQGLVMARGAGAVARSKNFLFGNGHEHSVAGMVRNHQFDSFMEAGERTVWKHGKVVNKFYTSGSKPVGSTIRGFQSRAASTEAEIGALEAEKLAYVRERARSGYLSFEHGAELENLIEKTAKAQRALATAEAEAAVPGGSLRQQLERKIAVEEAQRLVKVAKGYEEAFGDYSDVHNLIRSERGFSFEKTVQERQAIAKGWLTSEQNTLSQFEKAAKQAAKAKRTLAEEFETTPPHDEIRTNRLKAVDETYTARTNGAQAVGDVELDYAAGRIRKEELGLQKLTATYQARASENFHREYDALYKDAFQPAGSPTSPTIDAARLARMQETLDGRTRAAKHEAKAEVNKRYAIDHAKVEHEVAEARAPGEGQKKVAEKIFEAEKAAAEKARNIEANYAFRSSDPTLDNALKKEYYRRYVRDWKNIQREAIDARKNAIREYAAAFPEDKKFIDQAQKTAKHRERSARREGFMAGFRNPHSAPTRWFSDSEFGNPIEHRPILVPKQRMVLDTVKRNYRNDNETPFVTAGAIGVAGVAAATLTRYDLDRSLRQSPELTYEPAAGFDFGGDNESGSRAAVRSSEPVVVAQNNSVDPQEGEEQETSDDKSVVAGLSDATTPRTVTESTDNVGNVSRGFVAAVTPAPGEAPGRIAGPVAEIPANASTPVQPEDSSAVRLELANAFRNPRDYASKVMAHVGGDLDAARDYFSGKKYDEYRRMHYISNNLKEAGVGLGGRIEVSTDGEHLPQNRFSARRFSPSVAPLFTGKSNERNGARVDLLSMGIIDGIRDYYAKKPDANGVSALDRSLVAMRTLRQPSTTNDVVLAANTPAASSNSDD